MACGCVSHKQGGQFVSQKEGINYESGHLVSQVRLELEIQIHWSGDGKSTIVVNQRQIE